MPGKDTVDVRVSFVGRTDELDRLERILDFGGSVTLTGPGGVGKSRLALEAVRRWEHRTGRNASFVALAAVSPEAVADAVANALAVHAEPRRPVLDSLADALAGERHTLVLDSCEHAPAEAAAVVERIASLDGIGVVATSRSKLGYGEESVLPVVPFDVRVASEFFAARARSASISVDPNGPYAEAIERIVTSLDGLAVAIDLAAARLASLTVDELADELAEPRPYHFRSSGSREPRHWSLNHVVDWSVSRLSEKQRRVFALAGRFAQSFGVKDIDALLGGEAEEGEAERELDVLCEQSLLAPAGDAYAMLAPIRAVSARRLARLTDRKTVDARFAARMNDLALQISGSAAAPGTANTLAQIAGRYEDFTSALSWAAESPRERFGGVAFIFDALVSIWGDGGRFAEGIRWCDRVMPFVSELELPVRSRILYGAIIVAHAAGEYGRMHMLGPQLITTFTIANDSLGLARAYNALGAASVASERYDAAETYCRTSMALYEALGRKRGVAAASINLGTIALDGRGDSISATQLFEKAVELLPPGEADAMLAIARGNLGDAALERNDAAEAERQARLAIECLAGTGNAAQEAWHRTTIARAKFARGNLSGAVRELAQALALLREQPQAPYLCGAVASAARFAAESGVASHAAPLAYAVRAFRKERGVPSASALLREERAALDRVRRDLGEAALGAASAQAKSFDQRELLAAAARAMERLDTGA